MLVEQALKNLELRYRRLFEAAQDGILLLDAKTDANTDVNPFLIKMLGYTREEFVEKKLWEVGAFQDVEASQEAFEALQKNEYIRYEDLPLRAKSGKLLMWNLLVMSIWWAARRSSKAISVTSPSVNKFRRPCSERSAPARVVCLGSPDWFIQPALYGRNPGT